MSELSQLTFWQDTLTSRKVLPVPQTHALAENLTPSEVREGYSTTGEANYEVKYGWEVVERGRALRWPELVERGCNSLEAIDSPLHFHNFRAVRFGSIFRPAFVAQAANHSLDDERKVQMYGSLGEWLQELISDDVAHEDAWKTAISEVGILALLPGNVLPASPREECNLLNARHNHDALVLQAHHKIPIQTKYTKSDSSNYSVASVRVAFTGIVNEVLMELQDQMDTLYGDQEFIGSPLRIRREQVALYAAGLLARESRREALSELERDILARCRSNLSKRIDETLEERGQVV